MNYVIDTSAWVEYFQGSDKGRVVKEIVENKKNKIHTNLVNYAELISFFHRNNKDFERVKQLVYGLTAFFYFYYDFAEEAGEIHAELKRTKRNISLADAFVIATAKKLKAKIVTADYDFDNLDNV